MEHDRDAHAYPTAPETRNGRKHRWGVPLQPGFSLAPVRDDAAPMRALIAQARGPDPQAAHEANELLAATWERDLVVQDAIDRHEDAWTSWARSAGIDPYAAPATAVARYIGGLRYRYSIRVVRDRVRAISEAHLRRGAEDPTTSDLVARALEVIARNSKARELDIRPILAEDYLRILRAIPMRTLIDLRDFVLIGLAWETAGTNGELRALQVPRDVRFEANGLRITYGVKRNARHLFVERRAELDVVTHVHDWIARAHITDGPLLRSVDRGRISEEAPSSFTLCNILKRRAAAVGLDPEHVTFKSLRDGHIATLLLRGADEYEVMRRAGLITRAMLRRMTADVLPRLRAD